MSNVKFTKYECDFYEDGRQYHGRKKKKKGFQSPFFRKPAATQWEFEPRGLLGSLACCRPPLRSPLLDPALAFVQHRQARGCAGADRKARPRAALQLLPGLCKVLSGEVS